MLNGGNDLQGVENVFEKNIDSFDEKYEFVSLAGSQNCLALSLQLVEIINVFNQIYILVLHFIRINI